LSEVKHFSNSKKNQSRIR